MNGNEQAVNENPKKNEICLTPGCGKPVRTIGVCLSCYQSHRRAVRRGDTTWDALGDAGLVSLKPRSIATAARESAGLTSTNSAGNATQS